MFINNGENKIIWDHADLFVALMFMFVTTVIVVPIFDVMRFLPNPIRLDYKLFVVLLVPTIYLLRKYPLTRSDLGLTDDRVAKVISGGIICGVIISFRNIAHITSPVPDPNPKYYVEIANGRFSVYHFVFFSAIIIPIIEELFFRGCIYRILKHRFNAFAAVTITGVIFALGHLDITYFIYSFILVAVYEFTKGLGASILAHILWNSIYLFRLYIHIGGT